MCKNIPNTIGNELIIMKETLKMGRGIFAKQNIKKGSIVELCPVIVCLSEDSTHIDKTFLYNYYFSWGEKKELVGIALGFGSIYNHSFCPNAVYEKDFIKNILVIRALNDIAEGDEIFTNYNGDPKNQKKLWFEVD